MQEVIINPDREALLAAWDGASDRQRKAVLWDIPRMMERRKYFEALPEAAHTVFMGKLFGKPSLVAWVMAREECPLVCDVHFMVCDPAISSRDAENYKRLINLCKGVRHLASMYFWTMICLVPVCWFGCRELLARLSFNVGPDFPYCRIVNGRRMGLVMYWQKIRMCDSPRRVEYANAKMEWQWR